MFLSNCRPRKIPCAGAAALLIALLLCACSRDPSRAKQDYLRSAESYYKSGKYQEAVVELRNALQLDPKFTVAHRQMAAAYLKLGSFEGAYKELHEAIDLEPGNTDARLDLASLLLTTHRYKEAQTAAESVLKLQPSSARAHAIIGEKYLVTQDQQHAINELRKAIDADPRWIEGYRALGAAYLGAGNIDEAEATYKSGVVANPTSVTSHIALAEFWVSQHKPADAEGELRKAVQLDPNAVLPRLLLGRIYVETSRPNEAERLFRELKSIAPNDPSAYQSLAAFYTSTGQKENALREWRKLLAEKPKDAAVKIGLLETLLASNQIEEARLLDEQILAKTPADPKGLLAEGRILLLEANYEKATSILRSAIKIDRSCASCYYFLGMSQMSSGLSMEAKDSFAHALELAPRMPQAATALARLEASTGEYGPAVELAERATTENPKLASAYVTEARALIAKGDLKEAESRLEEALKQDDTSEPAVATMLSLYMRQDKTKLLVPRISKLVEQHPQKAGLRVLLGVAHLNLRNLDKAEANAQQALMIDHKARDAYFLLGNIDLARGFVEPAKAHFRAAVQADPKSVPAYLSLEALYEKEGNWQEAEHVCEQARQTLPSVPILSFVLAHLYLDHGGNPNVALSLAQFAKQKMPSAATADLLGWAYYKTGAIDVAITQLKKSVEGAPKNPSFQYHLGMAYLASGQSALARQSLIQALASHSESPDASNARAELQRLSKPPIPGIRP